MISIVVCDDQNTFLEHLVDGIETTLDWLNEKAKVYSFAQVEHIPNSILSGCDIALLDIDFESGHYNSIDLARKIRAVRKDAVIIFVTNYIEYTPEGYEVNAFRYLLKSELTRKLPVYIAEALAQGAVLDDGTALRVSEKSCNMITPPYFDTVAFGVCGGNGGVSGRGYHLKTSW